MKIDDESTAATASSLAEMPPASARLLTALREAPNTVKFVEEMNRGKEFQSVLGKTDLSKWVEILNRCDNLLDIATMKDSKGVMQCDRVSVAKQHSIAVLRFTTLLFECTSSRRVYRSIDRILALMQSTDMDILIEVLRLLQTMGKRSKFLSQRLCPYDSAVLVDNLIAIAQSWGGKLRSVKMADCMKHVMELPTLFPFKFNDLSNRQITVPEPHIDDCLNEVVKKCLSVETMKVQQQTSGPSPPPLSLTSAPVEYSLLSRLRTMRGFEKRAHRANCLIARLLAVSTLIYSRCQQEVSYSSLLYNGFVEELVDLLKTERNEGDDEAEAAILDTIHTEALSTLCSIVSLEKDPKIKQILDALSANSYHGFLSVLTRQVVDELKLNNLGIPGKPSVQLSTALFSFIYHLASIEPGGETLVGSGLTQTLLSVIAHHDLPIELITFGTRCARIIDLFTTIDVAAFKAHNGMEICIERIVYEIGKCREEQPFMIDVSDDCCFDGEDESGEPRQPEEEEHVSVAATEAVETDAADVSADRTLVQEEVTNGVKGGPWVKSPHTGLVCHQQRSGLIKGLLTFVKRAIQDVQFIESVRHIMDGGLPEALMHILSNADYYSPSLFHQSAQVITSFICQEPGQLTSLQRRHVPFVLLQSLLRKELPNSRDVISHMISVFTALCLNDRGRIQFKSYDPFDQIFRILLSIKFLVTMKKKKSEMTEVSQSLGMALDDLLRHHPSLRPIMLKSISKVLSRLIEIGQNPPDNTEIVMALAKQMVRNIASGNPLVIQANNSSMQPSISLISPGTASTATSTARRLVNETPQEAMEVDSAPTEAVVEDSPEAMEDDDEEEEDIEESDDEEAEMSMDEMSGGDLVSNAPQSPTSPPSPPEECCSPEIKKVVKKTRDESGLDMDCDDGTGTGRRILPLGDYMLISSKIFEMLVTQQTSVEMVEGFVDAGGIEKLLSLCRLPCLNKESALNAFSNSVANIIKFIVFQRNQRRSDKPMECVMKEFVETMRPLLKDNPAMFIASAQEATSSIQAGDSNNIPAGPLPAMSMMANVGAETIHNTLTNLNNMLPVLQTITRCVLGGHFPHEMRSRVWEQWVTPSGRQLYRDLRLMSRVLVWENALIRVLKPPNRSCATQTEPAELTAEHQKNQENVGAEPSLDQEGLKPSIWQLAGVSEDEYMFWKQEKTLVELLEKTSKGVSELLSLLPRSINRRQRRPESMSARVKQLSKIIFDSIYKDLVWTNPRCVATTTTMDYARWTELLSQLTSAMFDEQNKANSLTVIQLFYTSGCHRAFFDLLNISLVPALEKECQPSLEDVLLEWCRLAGKLAIRQNVLAAKKADARRDPSYSPSTDFDLDKYIRLVYHDLFISFTKMFDKLSKCEEKELISYQSICENAMHVMKEVVSNLCNEDTTSGDVSASSSSGTSANVGALAAPISNFWRPDRLQRLQEHEIENMEHDNMNIVRLLNAPSDDEDSLFQFFRPSVDAPTTPNEVAYDSLAEDDQPEAAAPLITPLTILNIEDISLQPSCLKLMALCKRLILLAPDLVFSCSEFINSVQPVLSEQWRKEALIGEIMANELITLADDMMKSSQPTDTQINALATRVHLACLLFDGVAKEYIEACKTYPIIDTVIGLLYYVNNNFTNRHLSTKLLPSLLLWIDLYDKNHRTLLRLAVLKKYEKNINWQFASTDERVSGRNSPRKYQTFSPDNQTKVTEAFMNGKQSVKVVIKSDSLPSTDREYELSFTQMRLRPVNVNVQYYADTTNRIVRAEINDEIAIDLNEIVSEELTQTWKQDDGLRLLDLILNFLRKGSLQYEAAHSLLSFTSRFIKPTEHCLLFILNEGVDALIHLKCSKTMPAMSTLSSVIIRNCIDKDPDILAVSMEKAIRSFIGQSSRSWRSGILKPKEYYDMLNRLIPLSIRNPEVFVTTMAKMVRLDGDKMQLADRTATSFTQKPAHIEEVAKLVKKLVNEVLNGEWQPTSLNSMPRLYTRPALITLLAELVKSYPFVSSIICEMAPIDGKSVVHHLIEDFVDPIHTFTQDGPSALCALFTSMMVSSHSPKVQESLVSDIKAVLQQEIAAEEKEKRDTASSGKNVPTIQGTDSTVVAKSAEAVKEPNSSIVSKNSGSVQKGDAEPLAMKISLICSLISHMCEIQSSAPFSQNRQRLLQHSVLSTPLVRIFQKKKIPNDLVMAISALHVSHKGSVETVNQVLKTLESLVKPPGEPCTRHQSTAIGSSAAERAVARIHLEATNRTRRFIQRHGDRHWMHDADDATLIIRSGPSSSAQTSQEAPAEAASSSANNASVVHDPDETSVDIPYQQGNNSADEEVAEVDESMVFDESRQEGEGNEDDDDEEEEEGEGLAEDGDEEDDNDENGVEDEEEDDHENEEDDDDDEDDQEEDEEDTINVDVRDMLYDGEDIPREPRDELSSIFVGEYGSLVGNTFSSVMRDMRTVGHTLPESIRQNFFNFTDILINDGGGNHAVESDYMEMLEQRSQHPLLDRPSNTEEAARARAYSPAVRPTHVLATNQTATLQRQNAIRRGFDQTMTTAGNRTSNLRLMNDFFTVSNYSTNAFDTRFFVAPLNALSTPNNEEEVRRNALNVPVMSSYERFLKFTAINEAFSIRYIAILVNTIVLRAAREKEKEDKQKEKEEKAEKDKRAAEETQQGPQGGNTSAAATTITLSDAVAPTSRATDPRGAETTTTQAPPTPAITAPERMDEEEHDGDEEEEEDEEEAEEAETTLTAEVLDAAQNRLNPEDNRGFFADNGDTASSAATVASSEGDDTVFTEGTVTSQNAEDVAEQPAAVVPVEQPLAEPQQPVDEEARALLGNLQVPEGIDPTFLAALPEQLRAEVIRDFERQQRAERAAAAAQQAAAAPPPATVATPAVNPTAEGVAPDAAAAAAAAAAAIPPVEPINQDFLQALPPELQVEVLQEHQRLLQEHARAVMQAQAAILAPPVPSAMSGAEAIAELPTNERQQVLLEMEENELQGLPRAMQEEARRLRRNVPFQSFLIRTGQRNVRRDRLAAASATYYTPIVGREAGTACAASPSGPLLLDRDAIITLCMLYLVDQRLSYSRLQKVLRSACHNGTTCDLVIWALLALVDKATDPNTDDEEMNSELPSWLESITVGAAGHNERVLRVSQDGAKVAIHSLQSQILARNVLELLGLIAKSHPGNFVPPKLRSNQQAEPSKQFPAYHHFWEMVQKPSTVPPTRDWSLDATTQLSESPIARLLLLLEKPTVVKNVQLQERIMRVASSIFQTLPNDSLTLMSLPADYSPLEKHLELVSLALTSGTCSQEGLNDGLTMIGEAMRAFSSKTAELVYNYLFNAVEALGKQLQPQIEKLIVELIEVQSVSSPTSKTPPNEQLRGSTPNEEPPQATSSTGVVVERGHGGQVTARGRFDQLRLVIDGEQSNRLIMGASSCKELQLPAVTQLTNKFGAQYTLLSALQTLVKVRDHMRKIREEKRKNYEKEQADAKAKAETEGESSTASQQQTSTSSSVAEPMVDEEPRIAQRLSGLNDLWSVLSECLVRLGKASDPHAVLALQPAAEAFFLVHASGPMKKKTADVEGAEATTSAAPIQSTTSHDAITTSRTEDLDEDTQKLVEFAEKHRQVLNQALRQNNAVLSSGGPFAILTQFPKLLDFDVKRKYFRKELNKLEPSYRRADVSVQVNRSRVFSDSFRELFRLRPSDWKNRFYIIFQGEEGQDAGGLLREWFSVITREIFNPNYALFITAPGDMVTYMINKTSYINPEHLDYFKFVGRIIAKAIFEHKYLDCYFTRAFYKHILTLPVKYQDLESEDPAFYKSLEFLLNNPIDDLVLDLTFSLEVEEFGVMSVRDLKPGGRQIIVTDENKEEYVKLVCQMKMTGSIRQQLDAFLQGFYEIIPKDLISMFNEQELELLISGLPTVDIDDLAANTDYKSYNKTSVQIQWFWRALRSFEKEDKAKFLQFVTGTSKVPLQGFASLEGMNGVQKFSIHMDTRGGDRLPSAHTCFNQLDLPQYESYEKLREALLTSIRECTEGFGFA